MKRHVLAVSAITLLAITPALAVEQIACSRPGSPDVVIALQAMKKFGRSLNCISGDFVADMSPCSPDGAFGLSAPTGSAGLVGVVNRWQDYTSHLGGIASNFSRPDRLYFAGGFNSPDSGYEESWSFDANRLTGSAILTQKDKPKLNYTCRKAAAKF